MNIKKIMLQNFRNLQEINLDLNPNINIFYGDNAQGKTNLLEAVYMCSVGRSFRTSKDAELINFDADAAQIRLTLAKENFEERIDVEIKRSGKKGIALNGVPLKRLGELFGAFVTVIFSPEDLQIIKRGPAERRRFIDVEICQLNAVYYYNLQQYYKILKQRNLLLKDIQKNKNLIETLFVWDEQMVKFGKKIIEERRLFLNKINEIAKNIHFEISGGKEVLGLIYKESVTEDEFEQKLKRSLKKDMILGSTSVGPHKDDVSFLIDGKDARVYASQGQQRCAVISAKLSEIELVKNEKSVKPVLLLDDILSEMDDKRQKFLLTKTTQVQTMITCTGVDKGIFKENMGSAFSVEKGKISTL